MVAGAGIATDTEIGTYAEHGSGLGAGDACGCCPEWTDPAFVTYGNRKEHGGRRSAVPLLGDPAGDLCARAQSQLAQDVVDVRLDRALGDDEASGDRFVAQSLGE